MHVSDFGGGLWGLSKDASVVLPPQVLLDWELKHGAGLAKRCAGAVAGDFHVCEPVLRRTSDIKEGWGSLFCCSASKRNVCRLHGMDMRLRATLEQLIGALNR